MNRVISEFSTGNANQKQQGSATARQHLSGGLFPHVTSYNQLSIPVPGCRHCHHITHHIVIMGNMLNIMVAPVLSDQSYIGHIRPMVIYDHHGFPRLRVIVGVSHHFLSLWFQIDCCPVAAIHVKRHGRVFADNTPSTTRLTSRASI